MADTNWRKALSQQSPVSGLNRSWRELIESNSPDVRTQPADVEVVILKGSGADARFGDIL